MATNRVAPGLQPQDLLITVFGAHVRDPGETVWSGGMVELLGLFGFSTEAARAALARLVTRGLLTRHKRGRHVSYSISRRADELLAAGDQRIFSFGRTAPMTDIWTVLWHAVPENRRVERSRLSSRLRFLGFGSVQDATWIAAQNREPEVRLLLRDLEIEEFASVLVGRPAGDAAPTALITQAWDLDAVARSYADFMREFGAYGTPEGRSGLSGERAFITRTLMLHRFRAFPAADPELPPSVHDGLAMRKDVVAVFDSVYSGLADAAGEFFESVAQPANLVGGSEERR